MINAAALLHIMHLQNLFMRRVACCVQGTGTMERGTLAECCAASVPIEHAACRRTQKKARICCNKCHNNTRSAPCPPTCITTMVNSWSQVCTAQLNRPLPQLLQANYGSGIFAVSAVFRLCFLRAASAAQAPGRLLRSGLLRRSADVVCAVGEALGSDAA